MWNPYDFTGKKIVIAGATSGIGSVTASMLADQGAELCLLGRNPEKLEMIAKEMPGNGHKCYLVDFSRSRSFEEIFEDFVSDQRKIDGLVYCAGNARLLPLNVMKKNLIDEIMNVNLYSFVEMVSVLAKKKYHNNASIVGISSVATQYPQKCQGLYASSKAAMNTMVTSLAQELAQKKIRINTVMPGPVRTQMYQAFMEIKSKEELDWQLAKQILGLTEPEDIASVILFLLSDASKAITGRHIYADGGYINL